jgi:hypothetical protein
LLSLILPTSLSLVALAMGAAETDEHEGPRHVATTERQ